MNPPKDDAELRIYLRALKEFYTNLLIYAVVCFLSLLVWLSMGGGVFWPIWVLLGCGINVALQAIRLDQIPHLRHYFPFLSPSWEQEQFDQTIDSSSLNSVSCDVGNDTPVNAMVDDDEGDFSSHDLVLKKKTSKKEPKVSSEKLSIER